MWKAFLTGSRVYGTPKPWSDIDLVVRMSEEDLTALMQSGMASGFHPYPENDSASLKFGNLNLICVTSDRMFDAWMKGTEELSVKGPVTRTEAIEHFATLGITPSFDSVSEPPPENLVPTEPTITYDDIPF